MPTTELTELKINYLSKEQYESMKAAGTLQPNEIYMTPEDISWMSMYRIGKDDKGYYIEEGE